jgi:spermidine synthase
VDSNASGNLEDLNPGPEYRYKRWALLTALLFTSLIGLVHELLLSTQASYLFGGTVLQFSIVIGVYLSALGLGAYFSKLVRGRLEPVLIQVELALAVAGGLASALIQSAYAFNLNAYAILITTTLVIGTLVGLEVPLLLRCLRRYGSLTDTIADALAVDYLGSFLASILFPLVLLPQLGIISTSLLLGIGSVGISLVLVWQLWPTELSLNRTRSYYLVLCGVLLFAGIYSAYYAATITRALEQRLYQDRIIYAKQSPYQKIVVTAFKGDIRLYLNQHLQFSSIDEQRYHYALVHPVMQRLPRIERILLLGAGDGLALREVLQYREVQQVMVVDLDSSVVQLCKTFQPIANLNKRSLQDPRVQVVYRDAFEALQDTSLGVFDLILADLPDPSNPDLARLYSVEFYTQCKRHLAVGGGLATQATSTFFAPTVFQCIGESVKAAFGHASPLMINVPSFGEWGFWVGIRLPDLMNDEKPPLSLQRLPIIRKPVNSNTYTIEDRTLFEPPPFFRKDSSIKANFLNKLTILDYQQASWAHWN